MRISSNSYEQTQLVSSICPIISTRFDHQAAFSSPRNTEAALENIRSLNGKMKSLKSREINLLILVHRDSEGKRNLPEALAKVKIR